MEKGYFSILPLILAALLAVQACQASRPFIEPNCPVDTGTILTDSFTLALSQNIPIKQYLPNKNISGSAIVIDSAIDSYCFNYTLVKRFERLPKVALSLQQFSVQPTESLFLSVKPLSYNEQYHTYGFEYLTQIQFNLMLYKMYTQWTLIQIGFIAEDKSDIEVGYYLADGKGLSNCHESGKMVDVFIPIEGETSYAPNISQNDVQIATFLHGFEIKSVNHNRKGIQVNGHKQQTYSQHQYYNHGFSPLQLQTLDPILINSSTIKLTISVTSYTEVLNVLISYVIIETQQYQIAPQPQPVLPPPGGVSGYFIGEYTFDNYQNKYYNGEVIKVDTKLIQSQYLWFGLASQQPHIRSLMGLSGFIINWSQQNQIFFHTQQHSLKPNDLCLILPNNGNWKYFRYEWLSIVNSSPCSDCEGHPIFYLGDCLSTCPTGTIFNGLTCIKCGKGEIWNGTHCVNICQNGKIFVEPPVIVINVSLPNQTNGRIPQGSCECPFEYEWNESAQYCLRCADIDPNMIYEHAVKKCICRNGYEWNQSFGKCKLIVVVGNCPSGTVWNATLRKCVYTTDCGSDRVYHYELKRCICRDQRKYWNGYRCIFGNGGGNSPNSTCAAPAHWNGYHCISCDGNRLWEEQFSKCFCPLNQQWNGYTCIESPVVCGNGYKTLRDQCFCPYNMNEVNGQCVYSSVVNNECPTGTYWNGQYCESFNQPNNGEFTENECPFSTFWNGFYCVSYADECPTDMQWNGFYCQTVSQTPHSHHCPSNTFWTGDYCESLSTQCPYDLQWNQKKGQCLPIANQCPNGTYFNGYSCLPYQQQCQFGKIWSHSQVQCLCPENSHWNGLKCIFCADGEVWNGLFGCQCAYGFFFDPSINQCIEIVSQNICYEIPNSYWNGSHCQCHQGFHEYYGQCLCDGLVLNGICERCLLKDNSYWNGYFCECRVGFVDFGGVCISLNTPPPSLPPVSQCKSVGTYFHPSQQQCLLCSDGCLSCIDSYTCKQCRPEYNFFPPTQSCVEICGDGKRFSLQCDDGNNDNGDGCSSGCRVEIENGFVCFGGSPNSADECTMFKPSNIQMKLTGQSRLFGKIVLNVKLNYLPSNFTLDRPRLGSGSGLAQDYQAQDTDQILKIEIISGFKSYKSITSSYIESTSFSFGVEIDFGREPIGLFQVQISINPSIQEKYFEGIGVGQIIRTQINPAYMARVDKEDVLG